MSKVSIVHFRIQNKGEEINTCRCFLSY